MKSAATNQKISWFKREYDDGSLDLSPDFQRNPVWTDEQAAYLVDSILSHLPIPEVYIRSLTTPDGKTVHQVVDGQQRLRAILKFATNDLQLAGDEISPQFTGASFSNLEDDQKTAFWSYNIVVRELGAASDVEIRDLFRRLNLNAVNLNDQELRHARYEGAFIKCVESIADDEWWIESGVANVAQVRRMLDVEFVAELLVGLMAGPQEKKVELENYFADYDADFPDEHHWRRVFKRTRERLEVLAGMPLRNWKSKTEFYSLFLAIGQYVAQGVAFGDASVRRAQKRLASFREAVDEAKRRGSPESSDEAVRAYVDAATRASTDKARRATRIETIAALIAPAAPKKKKKKKKKKKASRK